MWKTFEMFLPPHVFFTCSFICYSECLRKSCIFALS